jgi:hypothetical protein
VTGVEPAPTTPSTRKRLFLSGAPSAVPEAGAEEADRPDWWRTPYGAWRLSVEGEAMGERFPNFRLVGGEGERLAWVGRLRSSLTQKRYLVKVTYPWNFPDEAPVVAFGSRQFPSGTPHLLDGARPCLYMPAQGSRNGYDPARTTAATLVAWTALWIHAYETWLATNAWPGTGD